MPRPRAVVPIFKLKVQSSKTSCLAYSVTPDHMNEQLAFQDNKPHCTSMSELSVHNFPDKSGEYYATLIRLSSEVKLYFIQSLSFTTVHNKGLFILGALLIRESSSE